MRYELTDLKLFLQIAQARNLSAAAAAVHITASSASYRLKNLEQAFNAALFERTPRGMRLTPAGEAVLPHVRELFDELERMHGSVGRFSAGLKGHVRLGANSSALNGFATASVGRFLIGNPEVEADIEERQSEAIPAAVAAKELDIGIFAGPTEVPGLDVHPYAVDRLAIAVPADHLLAGEPEIKFGAALDFDFVCLSRSSSNFLFMRDTARRLGKPIRARLHVHGFEAALALVAAGLGIALVPSSVLGKAPAGVSVLALAEPWARRELSLATRSEKRHPVFVSALVRHLLEDPVVAATRGGADAAST
ncbi:MAG: LysR family transcriptional regulator [Proteobacteria bacterium]|nr:LysR family transcriptional regulator [Pseudomonadota bacterium]